MHFLLIGLAAIGTLSLAACGGSGGEDTVEHPPPETPEHMLTATTGPGGSIEPDNIAVEDGDAVIFTVTPPPGHIISTATGCGGVLVGNKYTTGPIFAACSVTVDFSLQTYDISISAVPSSGGSLNGGGIYEHGTDVMVSANPLSGYSFSQWQEGGRIISEEMVHIFSATGDRELIAVFEELANATTVQMPPVGRTTLIQAENARPGMLFASTEEVAFGDAGKGVWVSEDGGETWQKTADVTVEFLSIASEDPNFIIAGYDGTYLLSSDGGHSWETGFIPDPISGNPMPLWNASVVTPNDGIFVVTPSTVGGGLYRSLNMGQSWQRIFEASLYHVHASIADPDVIYISTFFADDISRSTDGGEAFFSIKPGLSTDISAFADGLQVNALTADQLIVNRHVSINGGANWTKVEGLLPRSAVWLDNVLLRVLNTELQGSLDFGASWFNVLSLRGDNTDTFFSFPELQLAEDALYIVRSPSVINRLDIKLIRQALEG